MLSPHKMNGGGPRRTGGAFERLLLCLLFAGAYGQAPLYVSNQNTYFLKGIALAEGGPLQRDWLVDSTNHIPAFTAIVYGVVRWMPAESFYLIHALAVAVYAYCLVWLIARVFRVSPSNASVSRKECPVFGM